MEAIAKLRNVPTSTRKMRLIADLIRGKGVDLALNTLKFDSKIGSKRMEKLLLSAIANWQDKNKDSKIEDSDLFIKEIFVDGGKVIKRLRPAPQGRAHRIRKRSNHVTMILDNTYMDTKRDIPFILGNVTYDDSYTGTLTSLRRINYTLSFTAKTYLYGPISTSAIIKKVSADMYTNTQDKNPYRSERVTVEPNPTSADRDDSYTYTTTLEFFDDAKNYDEATGDDK